MRIGGLSVGLVLFFGACCYTQGTDVVDREGEILCPFFKTLQPDTSWSLPFLWDVVFHGNVGVVLAKALIFGAVVAQKGFFTALFGGVLDLERLDQVPGVSHLDLYNSQFEGVSERLNAAAIDGFVTLSDLVEVKKWVAEVNMVDSINIFSQGETVFVFLGAGGNLGEDKVLAADVLRFLQSDWEVKDIGPVNTINLAKGMSKVDF